MNHIDREFDAITGSRLADSVTARDRAVSIGLGVSALISAVAFIVMATLSIVAGSWLMFAAAFGIAAAVLVVGTLTVFIIDQVKIKPRR